jgi:type VI secretion system VasD/TssJ family lipoprotein
MFQDAEVVEKPSYLDEQQRDHWLDSAANWRFWDTAAPTNANVEWSYQMDALSLTLVANEQLNRYARVAHALQVRIIQLSDVTDINRLIATPEGIKVVMNAALEMVPNAIAMDDHTLIPNQTYSVKISRQQDTQFVAIVAGFAGLDPSRCCRIVSIPVISESAPEREKSLFNALTLDWFASEEEKSMDELPDIVRPATLSFSVFFADTGIGDFTVKAF